MKANHTRDVAWVDLMERQCTIHISRKRMEVFIMGFQTAQPEQPTVVAGYVHVHILHGTNLIHPLLSLFFLLSLFIYFWLFV